MNAQYIRMVLIATLFAVGLPQAQAETRREGGGDVLRKAQYMIRQLNQEKVELERQLAERNTKVDELQKELDKMDSSLAKSQNKNKRLTDRVQSDSDKFKVLLERYRTAVKTLRQAGMDNQYMVRAVQEREHWITECRGNNQGLFEANVDLLNRYQKETTRFAEPITGLSTVTVENEVQEYRFKLEDLQVTEFQPSVDVESHVRQPQPQQPQELAADQRPNKVN